jgi:hypothetical protein
VSPDEYVTVVTLGAFTGIGADPSYGPVHAADLLVASSTHGCAKRSIAAGAGTVIGKALGPLQRGVGSVPVLVTLH